MTSVLFSDRRSVDASGNLLHITATAFADVVLIRSNINLAIVRNQSIFGEALTQEALDVLSASALQALERSAGVPIIESDLPRCHISGRVI